MNLLKFPYLKQFAELSDSDIRSILDLGLIKEFKRNEIILREGEVQKEMYLVLDGLQMSYHESERGIHVLAFTYAPGICAVPESYSLQKRSDYFLICLEDSKLLAIQREELEHLLSQNHAIEHWFRRFAEMVLAGLIERHLELHTKSIRERFSAFAERSPQLFQKVPHKYLASYLGMDPTNFSKLYNSIKI
jgi:CRP-like cAMP-binding protein